MDLETEKSFNEKGGIIMEKEQSKKSAWILALLMLGAFTMALQLGAVSALAVCDTAVDADCDGFSGTTESGSGIPLPAGMSLAAAPNLTSIPICTGNPGPADRIKCVNPTAQDLFVIIQRANTNVCPSSNCSPGICGPYLLFGNSDIPTFPYSTDPSPLLYKPDPLALVYPGYGNISLGVATHELIQNPPSANQTIGGWSAVKVIESLDPCSPNMGISVPGTPPNSISATVWPEKIMNWIDGACSKACFTDAKTGQTTCYTPATTSGTFTCRNANNSYTVNMKDPNDQNIKLLYLDFIQNIISHEVSHLMNLASGSGTSADHHFPTGIGYLMEQFINTRQTKDRYNNIVVTLYISRGYQRQDLDQHLLR
jgi:hypothetical protein